MNAPDLPDTDAATLLYGHDPTERIVALHLADRLDPEQCHNMRGRGLGRWD